MPVRYAQDQAETIVRDLYDSLLSRPADAGGLADKAARIVSGHAGVAEIVAEIAGSEEFANGLPEFVRRYGVSSAHGLTNDASQYGEVWRVIRGMVGEAARARYVVDVGARGRSRSNSYDFLKHFGWRGLLIEANPALLDPIRAEFDGLEVEIVGCAVSDYEGRAPFTLGANDDVSSLTEHLALGWGGTRGTVEVSVRRLGAVLAERGAPERFDLLSIDIEGEDVKVLNDITDHSPYRAEWVIIEASDGYRVQSLDDIPASAAVKAAYAVIDQTPANLILRLRG